MTFKNEDKEYDSTKNSSKKVVEISSADTSDPAVFISLADMEKLPSNYKYRSTYTPKI